MKIYRKISSPKVRRLIKFLTALFLIWVISFAAFIILVFSNTDFPGPDNPDYLLILGAGLQGEQPKAILENRLLTGLHYLNKNPYIPVVVSGGQGRGETISEAEAMRRYLLKNGIRENRILLETHSRSTAENLLFTSEILTIQKETIPLKILIVTSNFHMLRASFLAENTGFSVQKLPAPTPYYLLPYTCFREYFAFIKSLLIDL